MIWRLTARNHTVSIGNFARHWLGGSMLDRLVTVMTPGFFWAAFWATLGITSGDGTFLVICLFLGLAPWGFWLLDGLLDASQVRRDIALFARRGATLATRCEYLGGHPQLPHGRFAYLLLQGTLQNPHLALIFPGDPSAGKTGEGDAERFILPLLDVGKMKQEKGSDQSAAADVAAAISKEAGAFLRPERLILVVDYDGLAGRTHKVELTNFFYGNGEVRNWRNYLVCAQAEADSGVTPHQPWVSLPDEPQSSGNAHKNSEAETSNAFSRNGHSDKEASSAFGRR